MMVRFLPVFIEICGCIHNSSFYGLILFQICCFISPEDIPAKLLRRCYNAPLPELMDRKKRDIMERKGDKEDENKRQKQQKESSAAAL